MGWSTYEQKAWDGIQQRKRAWYEEMAKDSWARRAGERMSALGESAGRAVKKVPGADRVAGAFANAAARAQESLSDVAGRTLSEKRLLNAYRRKGIDVDNLAELRTVELKKLDSFVHKQRLDLRYGGLAATSGVAAGVAVTTGDIAALFGGVFGEGVGAAPGLGTVAAAMSADAAVVVALSARAVADTAMHYGFDPNDPKERLFALSVINVGSALTQGAKYTALADLSKLTQALARSAPWAALNNFVLTNVAKKFSEQVGIRLTRQKLGQVVPLAGIGIGATFNYATVARVQEAAYWAYRERLLIEKRPEAADFLDAELADFEPAVADPELERSIEVTELLEEAEQEQLEGKQGAGDDAVGGA